MESPVEQLCPSVGLPTEAPAIVAIECCGNCAFVMKVQRKLKCILAKAATQEQYTCGKFISKITLANDKAERKV
jgi:hypothetical protein